MWVGQSGVCAMIAARSSILLLPTNLKHEIHI
jgi:hypothetical protein